MATVAAGGGFSHASYLGYPAGGDTAEKWAGGLWALPRVSAGKAGKLMPEALGYLSKYYSPDFNYDLAGARDLRLQDLNATGGVLNQ